MSLTKEPAMIAVVTLCTPILLIIMSVTSVFGMGGNSVIARMMGEKKENEVKRTLNLFRSLGFIKESTIGLALGNSVNVVFDFIFIVWMGWGTAGAALATSFINMVTSYFQALGLAVKSLFITIMRNAVLFIPAVIVLNYFWKLDGVIAAQPVAERVAM